MSERSLTVVVLACSAVSLLVYLLIHRPEIGSVLTWLGVG